MSTLTARGKVSEDAKFVLDVPATFKGENVEVEFRLKRIETARDKEEWRRFVDSIYGSMPTLERPPQGEMPLAPKFD